MDVVTVAPLDRVPFTPSSRPTVATVRTLDKITSASGGGVDILTRPRLPALAVPFCCASRTPQHYNIGLAAGVTAARLCSATDVKMTRGMQIERRSGVSLTLSLRCRNGPTLFPSIYFPNQGWRCFTHSNPRTTRQKETTSNYLHPALKPYLYPR